MTLKGHSSPNKRPVNIGERFFRLVIIEEVTPSKHRQRRFICRCDCGTIITVCLQSMVTAHTKSCGCRQSEHAASIARNRRAAPGEVTINTLYRTYRKGAALRDLSFELTKEQFILITKKQCFYCGALPSIRNIYVRQHDSKLWTKGIVEPERADYVCNGIDRMDNSLGYALENCVACCKICNIMKLKLGAKDFIDHCKTISKFQESIELSNAKES